MPKQRILTISLWIIATVLIIRFTGFVITETTDPANLVGYYAPAKMLLEGEPARFFYDNARYNAYVVRFEPDIRETFFVNPPTTALLFVPLAWLPYTQARALWAVANGIAFILMLWWLARQLHFSGIWLPLLVLVGLLYHPIYVNIDLGQVYILLLGLELLVWHGYRQGKEQLAGISLGFMLIFKLAGLLLWPLLLIQKRWQIMIWGGGTAVLIALLSLPRLGTDAWQQQAKLFLQSPGDPILMVTAYQSWNSLSKRLFMPDAQWNPSPLFQYPAAGEWLHSLGLVVLLAATLYVAFQATRHIAADAKVVTNDLLFALFIILGMIISPATLDYHYPLLVLPLAILVTYAREQRHYLLWLVLLAAFMMIATDLPYRSPRLFDGVWAVLAYPKLYGTILLWGVAMWAVWPQVRREDAYVQT